MRRKATAHECSGGYCRHGGSHRRCHSLQSRRRLSASEPASLSRRRLRPLSAHIVPPWRAAARTHLGAGCRALMCYAPASTCFRARGGVCAWTWRRRHCLRSTTTPLTGRQSPREAASHSARERIRQREREPCGQTAAVGAARAARSVRRAAGARLTGATWMAHPVQRRRRPPPLLLLGARCAWHPCLPRRMQLLLPRGLLLLYLPLRLCQCLPLLQPRQRQAPECAASTGGS